jgi:hypothetical protein
MYCITLPRQINWLEDQTSGKREECEGDREGANGLVLHI